jgi:hypothetical protein
MRDVVSHELLAFVLVLAAQRPSQDERNENQCEAGRSDNRNRVHSWNIDTMRQDLSPTQHTGVLVLPMAPVLVRNLPAVRALRTSYPTPEILNVEISRSALSLTVAASVATLTLAAVVYVAFLAQPHP